MNVPIMTSARPKRWIPSVFSIVPDGAMRRRPTDVVRVLVATVTVVVTALLARDVSSVEKSIFEFLTDLPGALDWFFTFGYLWLLPGVVVVIAVAAVFARRWRFVLSLGLSAALTGLLAVLLDRVIGTSTAATMRDAGLDLAGDAPDYPPLVLAIVGAAAFAALPYLTRPARRIVHIVVVYGAISAMVLVEGLPAAIIGGLVLGWGVASAVQFALGTPAGTPAPGEVRQALEALGVSGGGLALADEQVFGESRFTVRADDESLLVSVIGRDATDARLVTKLVRFIWYKDSGPAPLLTRAHQVEHRAYLLLLAAHGGASVPEVVAAGTAGDLGHALVVTTQPEGRPMSDLDHEQLTDAILTDAWENLERLHAARLAHGNLHAGNLIVGPDGSTTIVDFARTIGSSSIERMDVDRAELMTATAAIVGVERAIEAAAGTLGADGLAQVLPVLQLGALSKRTRHQLPDAKRVVAALRDGAAAYLGTEVPQLTELKRVSTTNLLMAAGGILGVYLLLGELASVEGQGDVFANAIWGWVAATAVISQTPQFAGAVAMLGSVSVSLPLGPVTAVQFANNFTGLVGGTVATTALVVRFFQKQGLMIAVAISSGVLNTLAAMVSQTILVVIGLYFTASSFQFSRAGGGGDATTVAEVIVAVGLISGAVLLVPRMRHRIGAKLKPQFVSAKDNLRDISATPRKPLQLFLGNLASQILFALTLETALLAYGSSLPLLELVVINSFASILGGVAPVPGGMGVIEAGLIAGFTAAGVPEGTAIAATFTARTFTAYLPPIWGWFSLRWLRTRDYV